MPDVAPFQGLRYDAGRVDPAQVTAPPYDVIAPDERVALEAASPYNVVRLILGPLGEPDPTYAPVTSLLHEWLDAGVLVRDAHPTMTVYEESMSMGGAVQTQRGVLAAVEIGPDVLPHERTMSPIVEDRLAVIRASQANLSPVWCVYWTPEPAASTAIARVARQAPTLDFVTEDGIHHRSWVTDDPSFFEAVSKALAVARIVIADGHHRFRTAEAYRDERRASDGPGPWDFMLLYLVDAEREGPALLPIHRLVSGVPVERALEALRPAFDIEEVTGQDAQGLADDVASRRGDGRCYGLLAADGMWRVTLRDDAAAAEAVKGDHSDAWRDLDVAVLHRLVFERLLGNPEVTFVHHPHEAAAAVGDGTASLAVLLAPTPLPAVRAVAEAHDSMPPKSTFFVPKPRTGIVIRPLDG